jgi:excisionase family DNA binding protein
MKGAQSMTTTVADVTLLTVPEAAELLRLSPGTVYDKVEAGELAVVRLGRGPRPRIRIEAEELRRYVREGGARSPERP